MNPVTVPVELIFFSPVVTVSLCEMFYKTGNEVGAKHASIGWRHLQDRKRRALAIGQSKYFAGRDGRGFVPARRALWVTLELMWCLWCYCNNRDYHGSRWTLPPCRWPVCTIIAKTWAVSCDGMKLKKKKKVTVVPNQSMWKADKEGTAADGNEEWVCGPVVGPVFRGLQLASSFLWPLTVKLLCYDNTGRTELSMVFPWLWTKLTWDLTLPG